MLEQIKISTTDANIAILRMSGQFIGGEETDQLRDSVSTILAQKPAAIIFDLHEVTYLNSTVLGIFLTTYKTFDKKDKIALCNLGKDMRNIIQTMKLETVFILADSLASAERAVS
jgi:anti-anti-sigma factor